MPILLWSARLVLAGVFLWAGAAKLTHPGAFHQDVLNFQWIGEPWAAWIALGLPVLELLCAVAVVVPAWSRAAALVLGGLLAAFIVALVRAWALGLDLHCGCFGSSGDSVNYPWKLAQNGMLLLAALAVSNSERLWRCLTSQRPGA